MLDIMKCNRCGKMAMIIRNGAGDTLCCGQAMEKLEEKGSGAHVPAIERSGGSAIRVKVPGFGSRMEKGHFIEWIDVIDGQKLQVVGLKPGDAPEATFDGASLSAKVRAYCDKDGLWSNHPSRH